MTTVDAVLILLAGTAAGAINAAVGSGSLITFPTLLALGFPPVLANVSNNIGLVPGGAASVWGYRRELADQRRRLLVLGSMSVLGGTAGAVLLLVLPASAFRAVVPVLIGVAVALVAAQPWIQRALARRREGRAARADVGPGSLLATAVVGVYGGYFGGAQGILLVGVLGTMITETLQRLNALKNGLVTCVNAVAAVTFLVVAPEQVDWRVVGLIAVGSSVGGLVGSRVGRRLPQPVLRAVIVVVGLVAIVNLLLP
ncbi:sulfite exporter TauE/SafE family protein [Pseudonocardia sp. KRD-184]|uniref:Probable membrane transporter protein n=1 Tax=Pseudonocardia oceani TaxID=2792013 RepID=A0ABS6U6R6_9PSEU|nr:sulfite exporter TauE/SafE family protein [Pseudonocardia oceani]MBW0089792.1 sulfite exporter TauE/SafE family protein [Pseudonocardia oceani]MBW0095398.1 sulfite exporter TauE/SafE family protein [Pseudonocardia oceani]MBW0108811.1 sulfite exporter TauE/SafE family protein [Pseudonocardia oceani]MBW0122212.1 sulfite exporter TauE/SafE family protein [Pseudonocardia oceani]MBW0127930.1 sulfite exporter TauE/SafE family protein [Pseudonocardia oceani]